MRAYLKIKIVSLAAEARLIRAEERRQKALSHNPKAKTATRERALETFWGLRHHRTFDVRDEARSAHLAYGFLRGRAYHQLEAKCWKAPNWDRVEKLAIKYAGIQGYNPKELNELAAKFKAWREAPAPAAASPAAAAA